MLWDKMHLEQRGECTASMYINGWITWLQSKLTQNSVSGDVISRFFGIKKAACRNCTLPFNVFPISF